MREVISRSTVKFHCWVYCCRRCTRADVMLGVSQESSARPNEHGLPGLGLAAAMDAHGLLQFRHRVKDTAPDTLIRQVAEEPLHLVQPRGTGGGEMHVNPRMLGQPGVDFRRLVGRVVTVSLNAGVGYQAKVGTNYALNAGTEVHVKAGINLVIESGTMLTLKVGGNFINI